MSIKGPSVDVCAVVEEGCNSGDPPFKPTLFRIKCFMVSCHGNLLSEIEEKVKFI